MASAWMTDLLGPDAELAVEVAWGADLTADPDSWVWTEITGDVRENPGITARYGRADEASTTQPANMTLTLDNRSGDYSQGPASVNYPNVVRSTPIRVTVDPDGDGHEVLFWGQVVTWQPEWPYHAAPAMHVEAAGTLRRLSRNNAPVQSAMRRSIPEKSGIIAYWPMEEGRDAYAFAPAVGSRALTWEHATPDLASNSNFVGSLPIPLLKGSELFGIIDQYTNTGDIQIRFVAEFPDAPETDADGAVICSVYTNGDVARIDFGYDPTNGTGGLYWDLYDEFANLLDFSFVYAFDLASQPLARRWQLDIIQDGSVPGAIDIAITQTDANGSGVPGTAIETHASLTFGAVTMVVINDNEAARLDDVAIGHLSISDIYESVSNDIEALRAWREEPATDRLERLADENGETLEIVGSGPIELGPQSVSTVLDLFRETELAEGGTLIDGKGPGLTYYCRTERENALPVLELDASTGVVKPAFEVRDDDQRTLNRAVVTRQGAGEFVSEVADGPLGTDRIGTYDGSATVNLVSDPDTVAFADWMVHLGTVESYRYPAITLNLAATPELARDVLGLTIGSRINLANLASALTAHPETYAPASLLVEGISHRLNALSWIVTLQCSPYDPWSVAQLTKDSDAITFTDNGTPANNANSTAGVSVTGTLPDFESGDLLLIVASVRNSGTGSIDEPDGWKNLTPTAGNVAVLGRIARDGDTHPPITASNGTANATILLQSLSFKGVSRDIEACLVASAAQLNSSAQNIAYPGLTVTEDNCLILVIGWKQDDWTSVATLAGMTESSEDSTTSGDDAGIVSDYVVQTTATNVSSGSLVVTGGASAISRGLVLAFARDEDPPLARIDTDGSHLAAAVSAGATSMSVVTEPIDATALAVGAGAAAIGNNASVAPALPAGVQAGDLMIMQASIRNSGTGTVNTPSGWTSLATSGNVAIFGRHYVSGDTAPTVSFTGGVANATTIAQIYAFRNMERNIANVVHASATQLNGSAQDIAYPALTITETECLILLFGWKQDDWTDVATPAFGVELWDTTTTTGDDAGQALYARADLTTFTSGSLVVSGGSAAISRAIVLAIRSGPASLWTNDSDDYPMDLDVGGVKITATACADSTSPQTMTIDAAPDACPAGASVQLWKPPVVAR